MGDERYVPARRGRVYLQVHREEQIRVLGVAAQNFRAPQLHFFSAPRFFPRSLFQHCTAESARPAWRAFPRHWRAFPRHCRAESACPAWRAFPCPWRQVYLAKWVLDGLPNKYPCRKMFGGQYTSLAKDPNNPFFSRGGGWHNHACFIKFQPFIIQHKRYKPKTTKTKLCQEISKIDELTTRWY